MEDYVVYAKIEAAKMVRETPYMVGLREVPANGEAKVLVHMRYSDRDLISEAANACNLSQQKFMRAALVAIAHKVVSEYKLIMTTKPTV